MSVKILLVLIFVHQCFMLDLSNHGAEKSGLLESLRKHMAKKVRHAGSAQYGGVCSNANLHYTIPKIMKFFSKFGQEIRKFCLV